MCALLQVASSLEQLSQSCVAHCQEFRVEQLAAAVRGMRLCMCIGPPQGLELAMWQAGNEAGVHSALLLPNAGATP